MFALKVTNLKRYEESVVEVEQRPVEKNMILFYGSSGFTCWSEKYGHRPLEEDIRRKDGSPAAVNHGFGGSTIEEGLYYYDRMVKPWEPRAIVLRFFPNDVASGYSPAEVVYLLAQFCNRARADFPGVKLYLCDAMPHKRYISNDIWQQLAKQFNEILKDYCDANEDCAYVCQSAWPGFYTDLSSAFTVDIINMDFLQKFAEV